ncbi:MAG: aminobutyraldehyde dehydrogenase [Solirubrobacterales bacterium]
MKNFIAGRSIPSTATASVAIRNPATTDVLARSPLSTAEDVDLAVRAARSAFRRWSRTTPAERSSALLSIADAVERDAEALSRDECAETGKPTSSFREDELPAIVDALRFFAGAARSLSGLPAGEYTAGLTSILRREPIGVVGHITPWNYPLMAAVWKLGATVAAGNTAVIKPAQATPTTTLRLAELAHDHLPTGVINVVCGGPATGEVIASHADVDMVAVTGSIRAGKSVASAAAGNVTRVHLELGGNAPVLILEDADLVASLPKVVAGAYYNAGQDCIAATRVIASRSVYDDVVIGLVEAASALRVGDPLDSSTQIGPMISAEQRDRVLGMLERRPGSSRLVAGGTSIPGPGYFMQPTVVTDLPQDCELVQDEIFGPVLTVQCCPDETEAVSWANGTACGLGASIWTRDTARALAIARELEAGVVWINEHAPIVSEMPHGGVKRSGYGNDLSVLAVEEYTTVKHVMVATYGGR